jgi:hypothetical protein
MARDLIIGMSAIFLIWVAAVAWASSRLVWRNVALYRDWSSVDRDTRVKMALWLAVPMLMVGIMWQRSVAFYALAAGHWVSDFGKASTISYLCLALVSLALALFWAFDRTYGAARGDALWCRLMWLGLGMGALAAVVSWRLGGVPGVPWFLAGGAAFAGLAILAFNILIVRRGR